MLLLYLVCYYSICLIKGYLVLASPPARLGSKIRRTREDTGHIYYRFNRFIAFQCTISVLLVPSYACPKQGQAGPAGIYTILAKIECSFLLFPSF